MGDHEHQLTNSVEEDDSHDHDLDGPGPVRSYGCIFCRRGFPTAQALGGHMNIHRKDRAKNTTRPTCLINNNSNKQQDLSFYPNPSFHHPVLASCPQTYVSKTSDCYKLTYLSSTSRTSNNCHENSHQEVMIKSQSMEEKRMSLSLDFDRSHGDDDRDHSKGRTQGGRNEDGLDLELRLGHDP
ncbi:hypothetical protein R6Q57_017494 [Mikania cordata]